MKIQESATESMTILFVYYLHVLQELNPRFLNELQNFGIALDADADARASEDVHEMFEESFASDVPHGLFQRPDAIIEADFRRRLEALSIPTDNVLPFLMERIHQVKQQL